jgi:hypothetical protein
MPRIRTGELRSACTRTPYLFKETGRTKWAGADITAHAVSVIEPRVGMAGTWPGGEPGTTFKVNLG